MAAWRQEESVVESIVDKQGKRVDAGIKESVVALRVLGFETDGSCEGHLDRQIKAPWVDIDYFVPKDMETLILEQQKRGRLDSATQKLFVEAKERIVAEQERLL